MWPAIIAAGSSLLGGILGNQASEKQADEQQEFQQWMSSSAHQREVDDLRKAGLNPMLTGKYGGSSTPAGAAAPQMDVLSPAVNSGMAARTNEANLEKIAADAELAKAQAGKERAVAEATREGIAATSAYALKANQDVVESRGRVGLQEAEIPIKGAQLELLNQQVSRGNDVAIKLKAEIDELRESKNHLNAQAYETRARGVLRSLEEFAAKNSAIAQHKHDWYFQNVHPFARDAQGAASSADDLVRGYRGLRRWR